MEEKEQKVEYVSFNGRVLASAIDSLLSIILISSVLQIAIKFFDLFGVYIEPNLMHSAVCLEAGELIDTFSPVREDFLSGGEVSYFGDKA